LSEGTTMQRAQKMTFVFAFSDRFFLTRHTFGWIAVG
jgi:hypothetical protein